MRKEFDLNNQPNWLKIMQNGIIGELRAKAFLSDRFWILERSVDVDGVDFLIQRRVLKEDLYNNNPAKFGIVQVKYYQDISTIQYIPVCYFLSEKKEPVNSFFVILNTGYEDDSKLFFLTSKNLLSDFPIIKRKSKSFVKLAGKDVLIDKYLIKSKHECLNRIEHIMCQSSFIDNRKYLSHFITSDMISVNDIDVEYTEEIPNWYGDIPKTFFALKNEIKTISYYIEDLYSLGNKIIVEKNPLNAIDLLEEYKEKFDEVDMKLHSNNSLITDEDFFDVLFSYDKFYTLLKRDGFLDYLSINGKKLLETISDYVNKRIWAENNLLEVRLLLCSNNVKIDSILCNQYFIASNELDKFSVDPFCKDIKWISDFELRCLIKIRNFNKDCDNIDLMRIIIKNMLHEIVQHKYSKELT